MAARCRDATFLREGIGPRIPNLHGHRRFVRILARGCWGEAEGPVGGEEDFVVGEEGKSREGRCGVDAWGGEYYDLDEPGIELVEQRGGYTVSVADR